MKKTDRLILIYTLWCSDISGLSTMIEGYVRHEQITLLLATQEYTAPTPLINQR
jgi:hypothetical protein